jgi:hypothetical protein
VRNFTPVSVRKLTPEEFQSLRRQLPASIRPAVVGFFRSCPTRHAYGVREYANGFLARGNFSEATRLLFWQYVGKMLGMPDRPPVRGVQMIPLELL